MDINELLQHKHKLELDLTLAVQSLLNGFEIDTGMTPSEIHVDLVHFRQVGFKHMSWKLKPVKVTLRIE